MPPSADSKACTSWLSVATSASILSVHGVVIAYDIYVLTYMTMPAAKRNDYQAYETEVFETLASLVRDAASLRVYLAAAMRVEAEAFSRATT